MAAILDAGERRTLLLLARTAILDRLHDDGSLQRALADAELTQNLREHRCAFVTLRRRATAGGTGALRGCIGSVTPSEMLYQDVMRNAANSAFRDPRFKPVEAAEVPDITIEISALTPLQPVKGPEEIVVGRDGVQLEQGGSRALFLPQVAPEQGWGLEDILENLALKAGLSRDGWLGGKFSVFQAEVFGEEDT